MDRTGSKNGGTRAYEPVRLELDPDPILDRIKADEPPKPKTFFQRVQRFFQPVLDAFSNAFSSARDAILSVFFKRNISADPLKNIHEKPGASPTQMTESEPSADWLEQPKTIYTFSGNSPAVAEPASTLESQPASMPAPLQEAPVQGILGTIPVHGPAAVQEVKIDPPGKEKFDTFIEARKHGEEMNMFVSDPECVEFARKICEDARALVHSGSKLDESKQSVVAAAKELVNAHTDQKIRDRERDERAVRDAEKLRRAEAFSSKAPGQQDFEAFVEAYASHKRDQVRFEIYPGSKYLGDDCVNYGKGLPGPLPANQKAALDFLEAWRRDPDRARQRVQGSETFVDVTEPTQAEQASAPPQSSDPAETPPSVPVPRWKVVLTKIASLSEKTRAHIGASYGMNHDEIEKAFAGLLKLAATDAMSPDQSKLTSARPQSVQAMLNDSAEASRQSENDLESMEMANHLIEKIKAQKGSVVDPVSKEIIDQLDAVKTQVSSALQKKIRALLPTTQSTSSQPKIRIPSVFDLTDQEAAAGSELFEKYVDAYKRFSNSPTYIVPDASPYFNAECLAYANDFIDQVGRMPSGVDVDAGRLAASIYLRSEAKSRGIASF